MAAESWLTHPDATGTKASSVRAYRAAMHKWFEPEFGTRSLDRITDTDVEQAMRKMRASELSDKTIRNDVGALRALYNFAAAKPRRWTKRNPVADINDHNHAAVRRLLPEPRRSAREVAIRVSNVREPQGT